MLRSGQVTTMTKRFATVVLWGVLGLIPIATHAQYDDEWTDERADAAPAVPDSGAPTSEAPTEQPPAPPAQDPDVSGQAYGSASAPPGQWVYTQQYGWIWMPYADAYAYVPPDGYGSPYAYVYYATGGSWTWIAAPWIWGVGPWPFFGAFGPARFAWYGHGWWRHPSRWHYAPAYRGGYFPGRPAPGYRGGYATRPAPYGGRGSYSSRAIPGGRGGYAARPAPYGGRGSYSSRAFPGGRGGYAARPAPYGGGFRGGGAAPSARAFGGGRGGGFASPRGFGGRSGSWSAGPRSGGGGERGGGNRGHGRGHR